MRSRSLGFGLALFGLARPAVAAEPDRTVSFTVGWEAFAFASPVCQKDSPDTVGCTTRAYHGPTAAIALSPTPLWSVGGAAGLGWNLGSSLSKVGDAESTTLDHEIFWAGAEGRVHPFRSARFDGFAGMLTSWVSAKDSIERTGFATGNGTESVAQGGASAALEVGLDVRIVPFFAIGSILRGGVALLPDDPPSIGRLDPAIRASELGTRGWLSIGLLATLVEAF